MNRSCILGRDFFTRFSARIYYDLRKVRINGEYISFESDIHIASLTRMCERINIEPFSCMTVMAKVKRHESLPKGEYFAQSVSDCLIAQPGLNMTDSLITVDDT